MAGHVQRVTDTGRDLSVSVHAVQRHPAVRPVPIVNAQMMRSRMVGLFGEDLLENELVAVAIHGGIQSQAVAEQVLRGIYSFGFGVIGVFEEDLFEALLEEQLIGVGEGIRGITERGLRAWSGFPSLD